MAYSKNFGFFILIISFLVIIFIFVFIRIFTNFEFDTVPDVLLELKRSLEQKKKINCNQRVTYCFSDSECRQMCSNSANCSNGVCLNSNLFSTTAPINECDATKGVLTFFVGNPAFGRYEYLCKSVDPGIASDKITEPNLMCTGGDIDINYLNSFPKITDCKCPEDYKLIIMPATETVRDYSVCLPENKAERIL